MKKVNIKIITLVICFALLIAGFARAFNLRQGFGVVADLSDENIASLQALADYDVVTETKMSDAKALVSESDAVLIVRATGERDLRSRSVLSTVEVIATLYGEAPTSDEIYIYESVYFVMIPGQSERVDIGGECLMLQDQEYLICVKYVDWPDGYTGTEMEQNSFIFTNKYCSSFCLNPEYAKAIDPSIAKISASFESEATYADIQKFDFVGGGRCTEKYYSIKEELHAMFEVD